MLGHELEDRTVPETQEQRARERADSERDHRRPRQQQRKHRLPSALQQYGQKRTCKPRIQQRNTDSRPASALHLAQREHRHELE